MDVKNNTGQYTGSAPFQPSSGKKIKIGLDRQLFHWITSLNLSFCTLSLSLICSECNSLDSLLSSPSGTSLSSTELFNKPPQSNTVYSFPDSQASTRGCSHCKIQGHRCACCACIETHSFMAAARHFHTRHAQNFIKRSRSLGVHAQQEKAKSTATSVISLLTVCSTSGSRWQSHNQTLNKHTISLSPPRTRFCGKS